MTWKILYQVNNKVQAVGIEDDNAVWLPHLQPSVKAKLTNQGSIEDQDPAGI